MLGDDLRGKIFHQHSFVPGLEYRSFLIEVLNWLSKNPSEFVVISLRFSGFANDDMKPPVDVLDNELAEAQLESGTNHIKIGSKDDMKNTIKKLLESNTRLIFLNGISSRQASKYSSYSDAYGTADVSTIITALDSMKATPPPGYDYVNLQLQGTATVVDGAILNSVATLGDTSSPLLSTKANFDMKTYAWLQKNCAKFSPEYLLVFTNDFVDSVLSMYVKDLTKERFKEYLSARLNLLHTTIGV